VIAAIVPATLARPTIVDRHRGAEQPDEKESGRDDRQRTGDAGWILLTARHSTPCRGLASPRKTLLQVVGGLFLVSGTLLAWRQFVLTEQKTLIEDFWQNLQQLGSKSFSVRVGAIYSLEQMRQDARYSRTAINNILATYVRSSVPRDWMPLSFRQHDLAQDRPDVGVAVEVLSRRTDREIELDYESGGVNLDETDLRRLALNPGAKLNGVRLFYALLMAAQLPEVDLSDAWLDWAQLQGANLRHARLWLTDLWGADLCRANLEGAQLQGAILQNANLSNANLTGANLSGATLYGANLSGACGLTSDQVASAVINNDTKHLSEDGTVEGVVGHRIIPLKCPTNLRWRECALDPPA
jgi:hypothetical protein